MNEQTPADVTSAANDASDKHESARQLTEDALGAYVEGDKKKGDAMVEKAKQTDPSAVEEVMQDLDEDAGSDHSVAQGR